VNRNTIKEKRKEMSHINARSYRAHLNLSPVDFPPIIGLGETSVAWYSEPVVIRDKLLLMITYTFVLLDVNTNRQHNVFTAQSIYEIPPTDIKRKEDVYEFYKDALVALNESYHQVQVQMQGLPARVFPIHQIGNYQKEIVRVIDLLNSRN
jgi:hypothetical protein